jgi:hypothetical protein
MATSPRYSNVSIGSLTATAANSGSVMISNGTGATWANNNNAKISAKGQLHLEGDDADLVINGVKLSSILNGITDRLAILQPKPELLAKYANLREAYEHYKTLEALLHENDNDK